MKHEFLEKTSDRITNDVRGRNRVVDDISENCGRPLSGQGAWVRIRSLNEAPMHMQSVRTVLAAHMPHPALAMDRLYNVVATNAAAAMLLRVLLPHDESCCRRSPSRRGG